MKTPNEQAGDTSVTDEKSNSFIDQAPRLKEGGDALKDHILGTVLPQSLPTFGKYGAKYAEEHGLADGKADGEEFPFSDDCRHAFSKVKNRVSKTIAGIVNREKDDVEEIIRAKLPDMEQEVERTIDRNAVLDLMRVAEKLNNAMKKRDVFLSARKLDTDSPRIKKGTDHITWKFGLPLIAIVVGEMLANYWFLEGAALFQKIIITFGAVLMVYIFGFAINYCLKARHGIPIENNPFSSSKKIGWSGLVFLLIIIFAAILLLVISYRAGIDFTNTGVLHGLAEAVSNNIVDLYLALANIAFLILAIHTFYNAGWQVHKYGDVATEVERCEKNYYGIREKLHAEARRVFDSSIDEVKRRQKKASLVELDWPSIVDVCANIPNINRHATNRIDEKYQTAIKRYREGFRTSRIPIDSVQGSNDMFTQIPTNIDSSSPIRPLVESDSETELLTAKLPTLIDIDFTKELAAFSKHVDDWESANNQFDKLDKFAQERIKTIKKRIIRELQSDNINTE